MKRLFAVYILTTVTALGATPTRDWQVGKVLDSATAKRYFQTGSMTNASASGAGAYGHASATTMQMGVVVKTTDVAIKGERYTYLVVQNNNVTIFNRNPGCRFVIGAEIRYAQEKNALFVTDVDGKECKMEILQQSIVEAGASGVQRDWLLGILEETTDVAGTPNGASHVIHLRGYRIAGNGHDFMVSIEITGGSGPDVTVHAPVKYANEANDFYLLDDSGKEYKGTVLRKELTAP